MGLGILEVRATRHVPGTATLEDLGGRTTSTTTLYNVKRSKEGIILVPQPSDDPQDPLNWPLWQRDLITCILSGVAVLGAALTSIMAANNITYFLWFKGISFTDMSMLTGWHLLGIGVGGPVFVASARVWGKRRLYLLGTLIIILSSVWAGCSGHSYESIVAARFFQGLGLAPFEALINATVGDLYFVHESGKRMALTNMSLFGSSFFAPIIVGRMTLAIGWQWSFWLVAIFTAVLLPAVVLFCPETAYVRDDDPDLTPTDCSSGSVDMSPDSEKKNDAHFAEHIVAHSSHRDSRVTFLSRESLMPFNGRKTDEAFWKLFLRPFPMFLHPTVLWACLIQGTVIAWTVLVGVMMAFVAIQWSFNEADTGYLYTGGFIGALLGMIFSGLLSDSSAKWLTKLNGGIYEPEFRMLLVLPLLIFGAGGLYGFGITASDKSYGYILVDVFFGWLCGGMVFGTVATALYIVDALREYTVEAFTCLLLFKNVFAFGVCYSGYTWLQESSVRDLFIAVASVEVGICALTIPMYVFGKKSRHFFARYDMLALCKLK
ncbi:hypothetical protein M409DRAFT_64484 [Zasmidium cellare ATCC 36951]|uniref:Major facilitator superfamily (MFS) profile domain-containing protein n=1 Tax=Zasmidium cellare ATCC 36951 TaxID=1080233 RepID=A0A6A6CVB0_ZASCE|nr:uncharacterized protein M409DRAFT_64484 [Zasmidium cellare ATCC 36951]KAF2170128.1 hypothetical protein M409DRAFT_64484 [Zasmidium cellare ATCC 36951]